MIIKSSTVYLTGLCWRKHLVVTTECVCVCKVISYSSAFFVVAFLLKYHYSFKMVCYKHGDYPVVVNRFILFLLLFKSLCCLKICYIQFCPMGKLVVILCWFLFFCNSECVTCVHAFMFHLKPQPYLVEHLHRHLHAANNLLMFWFSQCRSDDEDKMLLCLMCFKCRNQE